MGSSTLADAVAAVSEIAATLSSCYGPLPKEKLLVTATRRVLITSSGATILAALVTEHPVARFVIDAALAHSARVGEGASSFVLMVSAMLSDVAERLHALPPHRQAAQQRQAASEFSRLAQVAASAPPIPLRDSPAAA